MDSFADLLIDQLSMSTLCAQLMYSISCAQLRVLEFVCPALCVQTLCTGALNVTCIRCDVHSM